jgi:deoxycytidylate deaminase
MEALKIASSKLEESKSTREKIENTLTEELVIGICAPIGTSRVSVIKNLESVLSTEFNYDVTVIKLSDFIIKEKPQIESEKMAETRAFTAFKHKIVAGNELRKESNKNSILAEFAIEQINTSRMQIIDVKPRLAKPEDLKSRRVCYIIDSLKNTEELNLLRELYRDAFYCFSIFSPQNEREEYLNKKGLSKEEIEKIMDTDEYENNTYGQNVRGTFVEADFFVRISYENIDSLTGKINRFLNLIFDTEIITPHPNEIAMYEAKSAAGNSACLSRQVGAAITNYKGEIISRGWNDVPKFGGNLYKEGDNNDNRCTITGFCSNDNKKDSITEEIIEAAFNDKDLRPLLNSENVFELNRRKSLFQKIIRESTKVKDLIEFSRSVHAEMHAIIIGSQLAGDKMKGGKLFCTTYPCHNCARHIIAAGIYEVYYIEPYKKSLGIELHSDAITEKENESDKVRILIYDGVAPRRYLDFFSMRSPRKENGALKKPNKHLAVPKSRISLQALSTLEQQAIHSLNESGYIS